MTSSPNVPETAANNALAAALLRASPDGLLLVGGDGVILLANPAAASIFGYPVDTLVGMRVEQLVPTERREAHVRHRERYVAHASPRPMGTDLHLFAQHADGSMFPVEISLSPLDNDGTVQTIATVRDVTDRQEAMARVALLQDRERIARDLHDMVIQRLFAAGMSLQAVVGAAQPKMVADRLTSTIDELDDTIREIRGAIFRLGSAPDERGLGAQISELVDSRADQLGFAPVLRITGDLRDVPDFIAEQLIATITEGLSNVARHANASAVDIEIRTSVTGVDLTITDNGVGIPASPRRRGGLSNMMWRAAELGGACTVGSNDPSGTRLHWQVPV